MPRKARIDAPGALHHIIVRGVAQTSIFKDDKDREDFLNRLGGTLEDTSTSCYAWALIPNHAHLLLKTGAVPITTVMRRLLTGYALYYNRRHDRKGHLFQNRFKSILCQEDPYFLELVRYIHLNPLRANLVESLSKLEKYPYSGHSVILGKRENAWQDVDYVLKLFAENSLSGRRLYAEYVEKGIGEGKRPELVSGGMLRRMDGWAARSGSWREEDDGRADERILGNNEFVYEALDQSRERLERRYRLRSQGYDFDWLKGRVAELFGMEPGEVDSPGKYPERVKARSVLCYWATRELGESGTSLARRCGLTQPAVSISVKRGENIVRDMELELFGE